MKVLGLSASLLQRVLELASVSGTGADVGQNIL